MTDETDNTEPYIYDGNMNHALAEAWLGLMRDTMGSEAPNNGDIAEDLNDALVNFQYNLLDQFSETFDIPMEMLERTDFTDFYKSPEAQEAAYRQLTDSAGEEETPTQMAYDLQLIADVLHLNIDVYEHMGAKRPDLIIHELPNAAREANPDDPDAHHRGESLFVNGVMPRDIAGVIVAGNRLEDEPDLSETAAYVLGQQTILRALQGSGYNVPVNPTTQMPVINRVADEQWKALFNNALATHYVKHFCCANVIIESSLNVEQMLESIAGLLQIERKPSLSIDAETTAATSQTATLAAAPQKNL